MWSNQAEKNIYGCFLVCKIRVGEDSHPSSGQLLLGSVDNAAAPGAAFALGGLDLASLDDTVGVAVGIAVAAKRPKFKILAQIWCSSSVPPN